MSRTSYHWIEDQVQELLRTVHRCQQHCEHTPHNDWDDGVTYEGSFSFDDLPGRPYMVFTCQVCGRQKSVPIVGEYVVGVKGDDVPSHSSQRGLPEAS